jgi:hypothetical protein
VSFGEGRKGEGEGEGEGEKGTPFLVPLVVFPWPATGEEGIIPKPLRSYKYQELCRSEMAYIRVRS